MKTGLSRISQIKFLDSVRNFGGNQEGEKMEVGSGVEPL